MVFVSKPTNKNSDIEHIKGKIAKNDDFHFSSIMIITVPSQKVLVQRLPERTCFFNVKRVKAPPKC